jgi:hypothetical protein
MKLSSIKSQGYFVNGLTFIYNVVLEIIYILYEKKVKYYGK